MRLKASVMRRGKSHREGRTLNVKCVVFVLWVFVLWFLSRVQIRLEPSFRTQRTYRDLDFIVVGFYEREVPCKALLSAVVMEAAFIPLNLSTFNGASVVEKQTRALRRLGRPAQNLDLRGYPIRWDTVVLGIDLAKFCLLTRAATLPGISVEVYNQLRRGTIFVPAHLNSTSSFVGLFKHVQKSYQKRVLDTQGSFFCRLHDQNECADALVVACDGRPSKSRGMDLTTIFDDVGRRYKRVVGGCKHEKATLNRENSLKQRKSLPHFWINLNHESIRRQYMRSMLKSSGLVSTRVEAFVDKNIANMLKSGKVSLPSVLEKKRSSSKFLHELGCTLSHLSAIHGAYTSGAEFAFITEDDVEFSTNFSQKLDREITSAPCDWEALQIVTVNENIVRKYANLYATRFVKWYPTHWSSAAYVISRRGMEIVLDSWKFQEIRSVPHQFSPFTWEFPEDNIYLADESIFYKLRSYTLLKPIVRLAPLAVRSAIQDHGKGLVPALSAQNPRVRLFAPSSLLIISSVRVSNISDYYRNVGLLLQNFKEFHKYVERVRMKLYIVCVDSAIEREVNKIVAHSQQQLLGVSPLVAVNPRVFNKFFFVSKALQEFGFYEKVLLLDSDMDLVGFSIPEYFELVANYIIAGTVHQNVNEMLSKNYDKPFTQWFKIFNGIWWENHAPDVLLFETAFVEQAFVLMDARFAWWFFTRILTEKHLWFTDKAGVKRQRESDFGPDLLWCGAAAEWLQTRHAVWWSKPCAVSTLPIYHTDDRQLEIRSTGDSSSLTERAWIQRRPLQLYKKRFKRWYAYSEEFVRQIGGKTELQSKFKTELLKRSVRCIRC